MQKTKFSKNHEEDNIKVQKKNNTVLSNYTYLISDVILKTHQKKDDKSLWKLFCLFINVMLWIIYISFVLNNIKITINLIRELHNIVNKVSDFQFTRLNIAISTPFDKLKVHVCILYTYSTSLIFLWSKTLKTFWSPDQSSSILWKKISMLTPPLYILALTVLIKFNNCKKTPNIYHNSQ